MAHLILVEKKIECIERSHYDAAGYNQELVKKSRGIISCHFSAVHTCN